MQYVVDHIFILTDINAPIADELVEAGITEGASNTHQGQGTANRRFFFKNAMIECMWVHNKEEADSELTRPTQLLARWQGRLDNASPFGICFRPISDNLSPPFPSWDYSPQYLPQGHSIQIANTINQIEEPFLFFVASFKTPNNPIPHQAGMNNITAVKITHPYSNLTSPSIDAIQHIVTIKTGDTHRLEVTFDNHKQGKIIDLQPDLPLMIYY